MDIWLRVSKKAHFFISPEYWENHYQEVRNQYLPASQTFVYMQESDVCGFASVLDGGFIGALFVDESFQNLGIGSLLIRHCKDHWPELTLNAYAENERAVAFYKKHGFRVLSKSLAEDGIHEEYTMKWDSLK
jgi:putative acetyltransferase